MRSNRLTTHVRGKNITWTIDNRPAYGFTGVLWSGGIVVVVDDDCPVDICEDLTAANKYILSIYGG
jgi:hypothetical protein